MLSTVGIACLALFTLTCWVTVLYPVAHIMIFERYDDIIYMLLSCTQTYDQDQGSDHDTLQWKVDQLDLHQIVSCIFEQATWYAVKVTLSDALCIQGVGSFVEYWRSIINLSICCFSHMTSSNVDDLTFILHAPWSTAKISISVYVHIWDTDM